MNFKEYSNINIFLADFSYLNVPTKKGNTYEN